MIARLGPAREHDVGLTAQDRRGPLADRRRAGGAGRDGRPVRAGDAELDRDLAARGVDERRRDEERRDAVRPTLEEDLLLLGDRRDAADRGADEDADPRRVELLDARLVPCLLRGGDGEEDVAVHSAGLLGRDQRRGIEATHLAGDPDGELAGVEALDEPDPAAARDGRLPGREGIEADRGDRAEGGDDDATHGAKSVDHRVGVQEWPTRPNAPRSSIRSSRFRRWRPSSCASCRSARAGRTSRSGTGSGACSRTSAASCGCGRATAGRSCATSRSSGRSASSCLRAPQSTAKS